MKAITLIAVIAAAAVLENGGADRIPYSPLTLALNGPDPLTVECYAPFVDPGATARGKPIAVSAGDEHNLVLWGDGSVEIWGGDRYRQQQVPEGVTNIVAMSAGGYHSLALRADGVILGWGENSYGQSTGPEGLTNAVALAAGTEHSLALLADGTVDGWGCNIYGQAQPSGDLSNVVAITAGSVHSLALTSNGTVVAWGLGVRNADFPDCGQSIVPEGLSNVVAIAAGEVHSLALSANGTVTGWGAGSSDANAWPDFGQARVPVEATNVIAIAAGAYHSLALKSDGTVLAWGFNEHGAATVPAGLNNVVAITARYHHNLALQADGKIVGWGWNEYGQANASGGQVDLSDRILVTSAVNTNAPGSYPVDYTVADLLGNSAGAIRTVIVPALCPGMLDTTFDATAGGIIPGIEGDFPAPWIRALALEPDGRIYAGGEFSAVNGAPRASLTRLHFDGTLDPTFQPPWTNAVEVFGLARQPDGKLLVLWRRSAHHWPAQPGGGLTRLNPDGSLDETFMNPWPGDWAPSVRCLAVQGDGRILVGGEFMEPRTGIARFHSDGSLDETFTPPLLPAYDGTTVNAIVVQPDGKILVGGSYGIGLLRLDPDGHAEPEFADQVKVGSAVNAIQLQPDGHIIIAGSRLFIEGGDCGNLLRLTPTGGVDGWFDAWLDFQPRCLALEKDGRVLVGGDCPLQGAPSQILRLNPWGGPEATFQAAVDVQYGWPRVNAILLQPGGQILIGGEFDTVNGVPAAALARLYNGPVDSLLVEFTFNDSGFCTETTERSAWDWPLEFLTQEGTPADWHGASGSGVSGFPADRAFDNIGSTAMGSEGSGGRAACLMRGAASLDSVTLSGWFRTQDAAVGARASLFWFNDHHQFCAWPEASLQFVAGEFRAIASEPVYTEIDQWVFFAVTFDGTKPENNVAFYKGTVDLPVTLVSIRSLPAGRWDMAGEPLVIGNDAAASVLFKPLDALLDNFRIHGGPGSTGVLSAEGLEDLRALDLSADQPPIRIRARLAIALEPGPPAGLTCRWWSIIGCDYRLQQSPDLIDWVDVESAVATGNGAIREWKLTPFPVESAFYRLQIHRQD